MSEELDRVNAALNALLQTPEAWAEQESFQSSDGKTVRVFELKEGFVNMAGGPLLCACGCGQRVNPASYQYLGATDQKFIPACYNALVEAGFTDARFKAALGTLDSLRETLRVVNTLVADVRKLDKTISVPAARELVLAAFEKVWRNEPAQIKVGEAVLAWYMPPTECGSCGAPLDEHGMCTAPLAGDD